MSCREQQNMGLNVDGGLATAAAVPADSVYPLPEQLGWAEASLVEPLACVLAALKRADLGSCRSAAVVGAGPMGLLAVSVLAQRGLRPLAAFEPHGRRRDVAHRCGATHTLDGSSIGSAAWEAEVGGTGPDLVVNATGHLLAESVDLAAPRATVVQIGYDRTAIASLRPAVLVEKVLRLVGSNGSEFTFSEAIELAATGCLPLRQIITAELGLDEFELALERMRTGTEAKVSIRFDD
jgi:threonine dehydrogenase-like Zn-dependent dehydrogenase